MNANDDMKIQEKMRRLLGNPPERKFSRAKKAELIARLFKVREEKTRIVEFVPFRIEPVHVRMAVALALILGFVYILSPLTPVVDGIEGTVKVYRAGQNQWVLAEKPGLKLGKNDIVKTFKDSRADVIHSCMYHIRLKQDSEMQLAKAGSKLPYGSIRYNLSKGKILVYDKKAKLGKRDFIIETPEAAATALGTDFMIQAMPNIHKTWVGVLDGAVRVTNLEGSALVEAGEKTIARKGKAPARPQRLMENELLEMEELYRIGTKPQVALLISTGKNRVRELLSGAPLYISSEKKGVLPERIEQIARVFSQAMRERSKIKHLGSIKEFEDIVNKYPNPKYDVQLLLFAAAYYSYLDEYEKSIGAFRRVVDEYPASSLASIAQYAIGLIYEEKLNSPEDAKTAYRKTIADYPRSLEAEEAEKDLDRLVGANR